jgi:hypothetical protein
MYELTICARRTHPQRDATPSEVAAGESWSNRLYLLVSLCTCPARNRDHGAVRVDAAAVGARHGTSYVLTHSFAVHSSAGQDGPSPVDYAFDLEWTPDETQFGGVLPPAPATENAKPDLFAALQQQLGLRLQASNGLVDVIVIDRAERP